MKNLKYFKQFLLESYHPGKETLIREITKEEALYFVSNTYASDKPEQNIIDLIQLNAEDEFDLHGAFEDDKLLGIVKFNDSHVEGFTEIHLLFVDPDHRNKNIGKMLIDYVKDNAEYKKLITNPYTDKAENFFKKLGFKQDSEIDPNDTNTMILENDNLSKSLSSMDKFGIKDDELPNELKEFLKDNGWKYYEEENIYAEMVDKFYMAGIEYNTCIAKLKEGKFPKPIKMIIELYYVIELERSIDDLSDFKILISNIKDIEEFLFNVEDNRKKYNNQQVFQKELIAAKDDELDKIRTYLKNLGIKGKYSLQ